MRYRFCAVIFLSLFSLAVSAGAAQVKIGFVDLQKALNYSQAGKDAKAKIARKAKEYEADFVQMRKEIKDLGENLKNQGALLSAEAKREKEREYQQKVKDFQRATKDAQEDLKQQDAEHTREIVRELVKVVENIGRKEGFTVILEKGEGSIVYADKQIDLTDKVIREYDKVYKSGK